MNPKFLSLLGLCHRAMCLASGELACEQTVRAKNAKLIIVAEDASDNTKKKFENTANYYQVPFYIIGKKEELGRALGKEYRAVLVVKDEGFAEKIKSYCS